MADLTITEANVAIAGPATATSIVQLGATIGRMVPVYRDQSTGKYLACDADAEASADVAGVTITGGVDGDYAIMATRGPVKVGATLTEFESYGVSANAGKIAPTSDLASGDWLGALGTAKSTTVLELDIKATGWQKS